MRSTLAAERNRRDELRAAGVEAPEWDDRKERMIKEAAENERQMAKDMQAVFSTPQGVSILAHLRRVYVEGFMADADPLVMAARAGKHDLVMSIIHIVEEGE